MLIMNEAVSEILPLERRIKLEKQIIQKEKVDIEEMSKVLNVSPMTIRRDLKELEKEGKVIRTHGGAVLSKSLTIEAPYAFKENENIEQKKAIALKAVSIIKEYSTIILDSGTTTFEVAKLLNTRNDLTILTNDIKIANELMGSSNKIIITGGEMQKGVGALFGVVTQKMIEMIHADIFFMGAHAIDLYNGITSPTFEKSIVKQMMNLAAKETWLLADFSKFNQIAFSKVCSLNDIQGIITDRKLDSSIISEYENKIPILHGGEQ